MAEFTNAYDILVGIRDNTWDIQAQMGTILKWRSGLDSTGSGKKPVARSCEYVINFRIP
jgi:hypothetical protein